MSSLFVGGSGISTRTDLTVTLSFAASTFARILTRCPAWRLRALGFVTVQIFWSLSAIKLFSSRLIVPVMVADLEAGAVGGFVCGFALRVFRHRQQSGSEEDTRLSVSRQTIGYALCRVGAARFRPFLSPLTRQYSFRYLVEIRHWPSWGAAAENGLRGRRAEERRKGIHGSGLEGDR